MTTPAQLRAFLDRPWSRLRELKDRHTAALVDREGVAGGFRLAALLRDHARAMGAEPSAAERQADLAAAVELRRKLDRASRRPRRAR
jgi:NAD(P)H-dependent FMN reductase